MKMLKSTNLIFAVMVAVLFLQSCKKPSTQDTPVLDLKAKVYVLNEGNFMSGNASVGIYDPVQNKLYNDLFNSANDRPLGDVLQSMCLVNNKAYFVVNNSNKIEITGTYPLTSLGVINGLSLPRYMVAVDNNKAYVSEYISYSSTTGRISIVDLNTNAVSGTIDVGTLPENMLLLNGKMYVCISGENKIAVINTSTNVVESTITVSDSPNSIMKDVNNRIWVLCGGKIAYDMSWNVDLANSTPGALVRIDPSNGSVEASFTFGDVTGSPSKLYINGAMNTLYYAYSGAVYSHNIGATALSSSPLISRSFYGLGVDPTTNNLYIGTYGFTSNQRMVRYTSSGTAIDSMEVGVGPNGFVFVK